MFKQNTKLIKIINSISDDQIDNWSYVHNEGASSNWKLDVLSYEEIRTKLEKETGLKRVISLKEDIQKGMPEDGTAAWICFFKIPESNCTVFLMKHYVIGAVDESKEYFQAFSSQLAYGVSINNTNIYIPPWRVYNIKEAVARIKFWVNKLKGISKYV